MTLTRGKLAKQANCNSETIRYYENIGLLPEPTRAENGYRIYTPSHLKQLQFIQRAKELGFTTDAVRSLLKISDNLSDYTRAEVKALTENHIEDIKHKITDLETLKNTLSTITNHCDGANESAESCPIINSMYQ